MPRKKKNSLILEVPKGATLRQIQAKFRQEFTAADLQEYTEEDEGIPIEDLIKELEAVPPAKAAKRKKRT